MWALRLICCGRDDGQEVFWTWTDADEFRVAYCNADGHDRAAILARWP